MTYNISKVTEISSFVGMGDFLNYATSGWFWSIIIIILATILLFSFIRYGIEEAIATTSFMCLFLSLFLLNLGWITLIIPILFAIILSN